MSRRSSSRGRGRGRGRPRSTSKTSSVARVTPQKEPTYIVEKILDRQQIDGAIKYKVKWKGYPLSQCTWEPKSHLTVVKPMVEEFDREFDTEAEPPKKEKLYEVEEILDFKKIDGVPKYKIHWKGYPKAQATWEPVSNCQQAKTQIKKFEQKQSAKKSPKKKPAQTVAEPVEETYTVQKILDKRETNGNVEYLVKWHGWPKSASTWEPIANLENVQALIDKFEKKDAKISTTKSTHTKKSTPTKRTLPKIVARMSASKKSIEEEKTPTKSETKRKRSASKEPSAEKIEKKVKTSNSSNPGSTSKFPFSPSLKKYGHFKLKDEPAEIVSWKKDNKNGIIFTIRWNPRPDGEVPLDNMFTNVDLALYDPQLLINFYEKRVVFADKKDDEYRPDDEE